MSRGEPLGRRDRIALETLQWAGQVNWCVDQAAYNYAVRYKAGHERGRFGVEAWVEPPQAFIGRTDTIVLSKITSPRQILLFSVGICLPSLDDDEFEENRLQLQVYKVVEPKLWEIERSVRYTSLDPIDPFPAPHRAGYAKVWPRILAHDVDEVASLVPLLAAEFREDSLSISPEEYIQMAVETARTE